MSELDVVLKTILYSYPYFEMIIEGLEDLAEYKAITSYKNSNKTLEQMQNILAINGQISKICGLQEIVNGLLAELSPLERLLIEYKFFKATPPKKVNYSARAYFRAQIRVFNKLIERMLQLGYNVDWFKQNYLDLYFLKAKYRKLKKIKKLGTVENSVRDSAA